MTPDETARFAALIDALDIRVASRPDILASPAGFIMGALIGAGRHDPADAYRQVAGLADVLTYLVAYVRGDETATVTAILDALVPAGPDTLPEYVDSGVTAV